MDEKKINRSIFSGRQESKEHRDFVRLLHRLAVDDPQTAPGAPDPDTYYKPMADEHGLFPDVRVTFAGREIILEAQLATIALATIDRRRRRYEAADAALLWVMKDFDPRGFIRSSRLDVSADQLGLVFDLPQELVDMATLDRTMRLRRWTRDEEDGWSSDVVTLAQAIACASPVPWYRDFKRRWIAAAKDINFYDLAHMDVKAFEIELIDRAGLPGSDPDGNGVAWLRVANVLMSIESGLVLGYRQKNLVGVVNVAHGKDLDLACELFEAAIKRWQPALFDRPSVRRGIENTKAKLANSGEKPWRRNAEVMRLVSALFPDFYGRSRG